MNNRDTGSDGWSIPSRVFDELGSVGVCPCGIVSRTEKSVVLAGWCEEARVAVKVLREGVDDFWITAWQREIGVNQVFTAPGAVVPVTVPRLRHTDHARVMVFDWVAGRCLDQARYPRGRLTDREIETILSVISAITRWQPPRAVGVGPVGDYWDRVARYHRLGLLTDEDHAALQVLLPAAGPVDQFNHGDLLATNVMMAESAATVIDWEFAGYFLPGYDLAVAYILFGAATPAIRDRIDAIVTAGAIEIGFAVNLIVIAVREVRMHRDLPGEPAVRNHALTVLGPVLEQARRRLQALARDRR
ncbi:phosphotransferase [Nocardia miyunensis]|uniref:phosphotransferase n=1 Tax=Nocardia miyunensis TaxID=282684 RepID=UPI00082CFAD5|nr:phosphotransferase [Nocardia miyunensis]